MEVNCCIEYFTTLSPLYHFTYNIQNNSLNSFLINLELFNFVRVDFSMEATEVDPDNCIELMLFV